MNYTKINENKIKEESKIQKQIEKMKSKQKTEFVIVDNLNDLEKDYEELNIELQKKLIEKKSLYETVYTIDNIDIEIMGLNRQLNNISQQEENYVNLKEEYERISKEYNDKMGVLSNKVNLLEFEKGSIKIVDKTIKCEDELKKQLERNGITKDEYQKDIDKLTDELEEIEKNIIILNKTIEDNLDINELHLRNEIEKTEVKKIDYEIDSKSKILKGLETYEYNQECDKCMKNPKVIEMFNIKECIIRLNVQKEKIFIDETITNRKEEYEQNKLELNKCYKNKNDKSSYLKVLNKDNNRNEKEMVDIENKIKLFAITLRIEEEKNNAEIGPLKVKQECLKKGMEETMKNMNCKKGLENKMVELENERILIILWNK